MVSWNCISCVISTVALYKICIEKICGMLKSHEVSIIVYLILFYACWNNMTDKVVRQWLRENNAEENLHMYFFSSPKLLMSAISPLSM